MSYTKKEREQILDTLVILMDTREQDMSARDNFQQQDLRVVRKKLNYGDYSAGIKVNGKKYSFENEIVVERKGAGGGIDELCNNITRDRDRFSNQLIRAKKDSCKLFIVVEDGSWKKVFNEQYRANVSFKSWVGSMLTFLHRYNTHIVMIDKQYSTKYMYYLFYYYIREQLKEGRFNE